VITALPPDKVIPKSTIGISLWVLILLRKFLFYQPLYRVVGELRGNDLTLPTGTIIGGLKKLEPLFQPLYKLLVEYNRTEEQWNADETRCRRDSQCGSLQFLQGDGPGESGQYYLVVLLGACSPRLPGGVHRLVRFDRLGLGLEIEETATLYQRNHQRLALQEKEPPAYAEADRLVREQVEHLRQRRDTELSQPDLRLPQRKGRREISCQTRVYRPL
jgi:hypothetical protein